MSAVVSPVRSSPHLALFGRDSSPQRAPFPARVSGYALDRYVGRDITGDVHLARSAEGKRVVVQQLDPDLADDPENVVRFYYQAKLAMQVDCPQVISTLEVGQDQGTHFEVTDHVPAVSLHAHVRQRGPLPREDAVRIFRCLVRAVESLHAAGVVHRRLDPAHVLITPEGDVLLRSLRYAAALGAPPPAAPWPASPRAMAYMSPEQIRDQAHADVRADVYALAATLYFMVTGRPPFQGQAPTAYLGMKAHHRYCDPETLVPGLDRGVVEAVRQGLMADQRRRPADPRALLQALSADGQRLAGYELLDQIGRGHTATVYRARDRDGRIVALKVLEPDCAAQRTHLLRFHQGAKLMMTLDHENLVQVDQVGCDGDRHFCAMELVAGDSLAWHIRKSGRLPEAEALRVIIDVALGLRELHRHRMVHRDVKPSNILLDRRGRAKLGDPGFAKAADQAIGLTADHQGLGTPQYMAPEQFHSARRVGTRADVYSLGATLYVMVTGRLPFAGGTAMDKLLAKSANDYTPAEQLRPGLSARTARLIREAMSARPSERPAGAQSFLRRAAECLAGLSQAADPATEPPPHPAPLPGTGSAETAGTAEPTAAEPRAGHVSRSGGSGRLRTLWRRLAALAMWGRPVR